MAGEVSIKLSRSAIIGGRAIGGVDELVPADTQAAFEETIPSGSTDYEIDFPITVLNSLVQAIHSNASLTLYTNIKSTSTATTTPHQSMALAKNVAQIWTTNEPTSGKVFTIDVTTVYVTNASGADAKFSLGVGSKQAPTGPA